MSPKVMRLTTEESEGIAPSAVRGVSQPAATMNTTRAAENPW